MRRSGLDAWLALVDFYEVHVSDYITAESPYYLPYLHLVRELIRCPGIEQLEPRASHGHPFFYVPEAGRFCPKTRVITPRENRGEHGYHIHVAGGSWEYDVYCPHVRSAVRAIRVAARRFGVRIREPRREQPEPHSLKRVWVVFYGGRFATNGFGPRVIPMATATLELETKDGLSLGFVQAEAVRGNQLVGEFIPGPDYPQVEPAFRALADMVESFSLHHTDEAIRAIDALGVTIRADPRDPPLPVENVQIDSVTVP